MRRLSSVALTGALTGVLAGSAVVLAAGPAHADQVDCSVITTRETTSTDVTGRSTPYDLLGMETVLQRYGALPPGQQPVGVAVLDTGVQPPEGDRIVVSGTDPISTDDDGIVDGGGTAVAGLVAGTAPEGGAPVGFAPDARIVDVQVAPARLDDQGHPPSSTNVARGLVWVAQHADDLNIRVATVAYELNAAKGLRAAVEQAQSAGVVVVAAVGDPSTDTGSDSTDEGQPGPQPDAAADNQLPAFPGVVAVNTTPDGSPQDFAPLANSDTTVAVPSAGAVTYGINGKTCRSTLPTTSAATAEVAGILALLWQRFPHDQPAQIVARLVNTASGTTDDPTPLTGSGIVQPLDALTRAVAPAPDGTVERSEPVAGPDGPVSPPSTPTDLLGPVRDDAVWWALIGGGLVVVALLLRPLLARRRP